MTAVTRWRYALVTFGIALLGLGGVVLLIQVDPAKYIGIAIWFLGALIIHDGIIAFVVFGIGLLMRRASKKIPFGVLVIVQAALVLGALMTAIVVPEILKKNIGSANPTILPLDYGLNLALFYAGLAVVTALAIAGYLVFARRRARVAS